MNINFSEIMCVALARNRRNRKIRSSRKRLVFETLLSISCLTQEAFEFRKR